MVDSFTWQNVSAPKGPSSVAKKVQNKSIDILKPDVSPPIEPSSVVSTNKSTLYHGEYA